MTLNDLTGAKRRLLERLKLDGAATARALARALELTDVAVRQHLQALEQAGLVRQRRLEPEGRGRPSVEWSLTEGAQGVFPDRHADLTLDLIRAARVAFGEDGLDRLLAERSRSQIESYRRDLAPAGPSLGARLRALACRRSAEGYMAEVVEEQHGSYLLIERHCPICEAAKSCAGLCRMELQVFRQALGEDVEVERTQHLLADAGRCAYRIREN